MKKILCKNFLVGTNRQWKCMLINYSQWECFVEIHVRSLHDSKNSYSNNKTFPNLLDMIISISMDIDEIVNCTIFQDSGSFWFPVIFPILYGTVVLLLLPHPLLHGWCASANWWVKHVAFLLIAFEPIHLMDSLWVPDYATCHLFAIIIVFILLCMTKARWYVFNVECCP